MKVIAEKSEEMGLELNVKKTVCMVMSRKPNIPGCNLKHKGEIIQQVDKFSYLGFTLSSDGTCTAEIKKRIAVAKDSFNKMRPIFKNRNLRLSTKIRVLKAYVWSVLLYGCECWKITKEAERRLEAAEMWFLRRMMNISWKDKVSNEKVLLQCGTIRSMLKTIRKRQLTFLGHIHRKNSVERLVTTGKIDGKKSRGRPRIAFVDSLRKWTELDVTNTDFMRMAEDRQQWRAMVANVCNRQST